MTDDEREFWCNDPACEEGGWWDEEADTYWHEEQPPAHTDADAPSEPMFGNADPRDRSVPVVMYDIAIGLRSLRALLGTDAEKHTVMLAAHYVLDGIIGEYRQVPESLGVRKAFLDIVQGL